MRYRGVLIEQISLIKTPSIFLDLTFKLFLAGSRFLLHTIVHQFKPILIVLALWLLLYNVAALHPIYSFILFALYWTVLGIASSIGLGTGLHTFVLYLGPHIAKVALIATNCGYLPEMIPSRWQFDHFGPCIASKETIGFFGILLAVQIQSFFWGLGTAIGQLPPYFVAKKASQTRAQLRRMNRIGKFQQQQQSQGKSQQQIQKLLAQSHIADTTSQIQQILQLKRKPQRSYLQTTKIIIYDNLQRYGFVTILACASIPNPLFDLAGITCGHFRIPFKTFFTATFIGKAIIKVHIQMVFVIITFRKQTLDWLLSFLNKISTTAAQQINNILQSQRKVLHSPSTFSDNKPIIAKLWDIFIIIMVGYFLLSILNGLVQQKAIELKDHQHQHEDINGENNRK